MVDRIGPVDAVAGVPQFSGRWERQIRSPYLAGATALRPLGARSGVRPGTSTATVTATSTTWTCGTFAGVIDGEAAAEAGAYPFSFDAAATGTMTAANASNPRIDIVYVQVDDPSESDGTSAPVVRRGYQAGFAEAAPSAPAAPARSFVVAQINVPKSGGGSPTVSWVAPYAVAAGAPLLVSTVAALNSIPGYVGQKATVYADPVLNGNFRHDGTAWKCVSSEWVTYVPTISGANLGSGATISARYKYVAGRVCVKYSFTLGSSSSMGPLVFTLPFAFAFGIPRYAWVDGRASAYDLSTLLSYEVTHRSNATDVSSVVLGTYTGGTSTNFSTTAPFTWAAGDIIAGSLWGDPA